MQKGRHSIPAVWIAQASIIINTNEVNELAYKCVYYVAYSTHINGFNNIASN